jgi:hypothetical protein
LNNSYPLITIWDTTTMQVVQPDTITSTDANTTTVTFTVPVEGVARLF